MNEKELINGMRDALVRVEGTIKVNEQGNPVRVHTKLQGIRDKLIYLINKAERKGRSESEEIKDKVQITVGTKSESD